MPNPLESPRVKMHQRILEEATRQFVERGFDGVSIRDLTEACQITNAALYYHFSDKEHLFLEVLEHGLEKFTQILIEVQEKYPLSSQSCLREFIFRIFTRIPPESRGIMRLATQEIGKLSPELREKFRETYAQKFLRPLERIIEEGQKREEIRLFPPELLVWAFLGMFYPFLAIGNQQQSALSSEGIDVLLKVFWEGVKS